MERTKRKPPAMRPVMRIGSDAKEERREAVIRTMREYAASARDVAERAGCGVGAVENLLRGEPVSDGLLADMETAAFVIRTDFLPASVVATWDGRRKAIGASVTEIADAPGLGRNLQNMLPFYLSGETEPRQETIRAFETALRKTEERHRQYAFEAALLVAVPADAPKTWGGRRLALRWSEQCLIKKAGVAASSYLLADWEDGTQEPSREARERIEAALRVEEALRGIPCGATDDIGYEVVPTWAERCRPPGTRPAKVMARAGMTKGNADNFNRWIRGEITPLKTNVVKFENALRAMEREAEEASSLRRKPRPEGIDPASWKPRAEAAGVTLRELQRSLTAPRPVGTASHWAMGTMVPSQAEAEEIEAALCEAERLAETGDKQ